MSMENPATWGPAERIVRRVLSEHFMRIEKVRLGEEDPVYGLSLERQITDALREAGLLKLCAS
jgi:hypothetical protein